MRSETEDKGEVSLVGWSLSLCAAISVTARNSNNFRQVNLSRL